MIVEVINSLECSDFEVTNILGLEALGKHVIDITK